MVLILKDTLIYLLSLYGSYSLVFILRIITAGILGPKEYGLWSILTTLLLYGSFLHLGLNYALIKEVSFHRSRGELHEINEIRNTVFSSVILISGIAASLLVIWAVFFCANKGRICLTLSILAVILILQQIKIFLFSYFAAEKNFVTRSKLIISSPFIIGIPVLILVARLKFIGLPFGLLLGHFLFLSYTFARYKPPVRFVVDLKRFLFLIKIGFPIL